jgi:hypothetical protein
VFRRKIFPALWFALLLAGVGSVDPSSNLRAQQTTPTPPTIAPTPQATPKPQEKKATKDQQPTSEQIAESVIFYNGSREAMQQIRRNGVERGRITRTNAEGKLEEVTYERRFIRGEASTKDRVRLDQKMPTAEYALIYTDGQTWGVINEAVFTPKQEAAQEFLSSHWHGLDTLLRYKENGSAVNYKGKEKQMGLDLHVLDVTDKEKRTTRFYISAKTARILWLEYEQPTQPGSQPVKFMRKFYDYRSAQGTLVPYRTVLYRDGKQIEETRILTITFGSKMDETLFQNPQAPAATTAARP